MEHVLFSNREIMVIKNADGTHTVTNGEHRAVIPALNFTEWCDRFHVAPPIEDQIVDLLVRKFRS